MATNGDSHDTSKDTDTDNKKGDQWSTADSSNSAKKTKNKANQQKQEQSAPSQGRNGSSPFDKKAHLGTDPNVDPSRQQQSQQEDKKLDRKEKRTGNTSDKRAEAETANSQPTDKSSAADSKAREVPSDPASRSEPTSSQKKVWENLFGHDYSRHSAWDDIPEDVQSVITNLIMSMICTDGVREQFNSWLMLQEKEIHARYNTDDIESKLRAALFKDAKATHSGIIQKMFKDNTTAWDKAKVELENKIVSMSEQLKSMSNELAKAKEANESMSEKVAAAEATAKTMADIAAGFQAQLDIYQNRSDSQNAPAAASARQHAPDTSDARCSRARASGTADTTRRLNEQRDLIDNITFDVKNVVQFLGDEYEQWLSEDPQNSTNNTTAATPDELDEDHAPEEFDGDHPPDEHGSYHSPDEQYRYAPPDGQYTHPPPGEQYRYASPPQHYPHPPPPGYDPYRPHAGYGPHHPPAGYGPYHPRYY